MYIFWGKIIQGKKRGQRLGIPTANLRLHQNIPEGIYVSLAKVDNKWHESISFIGSAKTFGAVEVFGETHIFDFKRDIYGKWISVKLLKKIRGVKKFRSEHELIDNINLDLQEAAKYFRSKQHK